MRALPTIATLAAIVVHACAATPTSPRNVHLSHGVASGEVTHDSIVLWARCVGATTVQVRVRGGDREIDSRIAVDAESNWTGRTRVDGLRPATRYEYTVGCGNPTSGSFRSAPPPTSPAPIRIAWGGDIGGQNVCRDVTDGYSIFSRIAETDPDLFVALGDMVYVDNACEEVGRYRNRQVPGPPPAGDLESFRHHWSYNRSDRHLRSLAAQVPYVGIWDDHEIRNDGSASDDRRQGSDTHLFPNARRTFAEYLPMVPPRDDPTRFYRKLRWGRHAEMFILDTRQYRDRNDAPDLPGAGKTLLGERQLDWLLRSLADSDATWRIVVSSVPLSIPTGKGPQARDGWSNHGGNTGFESEARKILRHAADIGVRNMIWITTDVHFSTAFRYRPFADHPDFEVHEFVSGPLNAGVFPHRNLDPSFRPERLFFWGPDSPDDIDDYETALEWFNFGLIEIGDTGELTVAIVNGRGRRVVTYPLRRSRSGFSARDPTPPR